MILYQAGSLFNVPKGHLLGHACNCQGNWGRGIATEFAKHYPNAYLGYKLYCENKVEDILGKAQIFNAVKGFDSESHNILCLMTSDKESHEHDPVESILKNTYSAIKDYYDRYRTFFDVIHLPKINSGKFEVPWEETEKVLNEFPDLKFIVWENKEDISAEEKLKSLYALKDKLHPLSQILIVGFTETQNGILKIHDKRAVEEIYNAVFGKE